MSELEGRTVLVTGAAAGIGLALARGFLADGANVVGCDVTDSGFAELEREGASCRVADVTDPAAMAELVSGAVSKTGRLDVLVNNAGLGYQQRLEDLAEGAFERLLEVNLYGPYFAMRAALPVMREQRYGRIVNLISRGAEATAAGFGAYAASKAGLFALTRVLATEVDGSGILVNGLIPGPTATGMNPNGSQAPESVYPAARHLATLPPEGPSGKAFWGEAEYKLFQGREYQTQRQAEYAEYQAGQSSAAV